MHDSSRTRTSLVDEGAALSSFKRVAEEHRVCSAAGQALALETTTPVRVVTRKEEEKKRRRHYWAKGIQEEMSRPAEGPGEVWHLWGSHIAPIYSFLSQRIDTC